ncbi:MAG: flagellar assembly protein FliW [Vicinamibacterales bacterium]
MSAIGFPAGLPGFEACRRFVLLEPDAGGPVRCLQSIDGPSASFLVMDPRAIEPAYDVPLTAADRQRLGEAGTGALVWLAFVATESDGAITANLRAPVVINPATMTGVQVIPHDSPYPLRHVLVPGA